VEKISLGSLMMLALLRLMRENVRTGKYDFIHVSTVACLLNTSSSLTGLSELPSMEFLSLIRALLSKHSKLLHKNTSELAVFVDLIHLMIEILCKIMSAGLASNPFFIQAVLHHAEVFTKLKHSDLCNSNVVAVCECIENCMKSIDTENVLESVICTSKVYAFPQCSYELLTCSEFVFVENGKKWEEFAVPYVWMEATKGILTVPNASRIVLFRHN
jgi:dymeclin